MADLGAPVLLKVKGRCDRGPLQPDTTKKSSHPDRFCRVEKSISSFVWNPTSHQDAFSLLPLLWNDTAGNRQERAVLKTSKQKGTVSRERLRGVLCSLWRFAVDLLLGALEDLLVRGRRVIAVGGRRRVRAQHVCRSRLTGVGGGQGRCHGTAGVGEALHARLLGDCWRNKEWNRSRFTSATCCYWNSASIYVS